MSYSRWSNSEWYTFWCCPPDDSKENRDTAIFEVCGVIQFSAKDLRDDIEKCIAKAVEIQPSDSDELMEYMNDFLHDVDNDYPLSKDK